MRRKNRKQKKVVVQAGKSKSGFDAEDEEEDVSIMLTFIKHSLMRMSFIRSPLVVERDRWKVYWCYYVRP